MKKFYYVCPRCGRQWKRLIPRSKMRCKFCSEEWKTHGRRGTRSRFSWFATFFWLFWILLIAGVALKFQTILGLVADSVTEREPSQVQAPAEPGTEAPAAKPKKKVPPIQFRTLDEIEEQKAANAAAAETNAASAEAAPAEESAESLELPEDSDLGL